MSKSSPLWLPDGSIRALVTLLIVGTACQQVIVGTIPVEVFLPIVGSVVTYYFVQRENESKEDPVPQPFLGDGDEV